MSNWETMTAEERECHINQDSVDRNWREVLAAEIGPDFFLSMADREGIGQLDTEDTYFPSDSPLSKIVDPVELECLRLFYGERMTRQEIADSIAVQHVCNGRVVTTRPFTVYIVQKKMEAGRRAIRNAVGSDWRQLLKEIRNPKRTVN